MNRLATFLTAGLLLLFAAPLWAQVPGGFDQVQGNAFGVSVSLQLADSVTTVELPPEPLAQQPLEGGGGADSQTTLQVDVPDIAGSGTIIAETEGTLQPLMATSGSSIEVEDAEVLVGLLTADAIGGTLASEGDGTVASTTINAEFVNLALTGSPINLSVPANTAIPIPLLGVVLLNEQVPLQFADSVLTSGMTYNGARVIVEPDLLDVDLVEQLVEEGLISLDVVRAILEGVPLPIEILDILGPEGLGLLPQLVITALETILAIPGNVLTLDLIETVFNDVLGVPLDLVQELLDLDQLEILLEPVIGGEGLLNVDLLLELIADGTLDVVLGEVLVDLDLVANVGLDLSLLEELLSLNLLDLEAVQAFVEDNILGLDLLSGEVIVASAHSAVEIAAPTAGWRLLTVPGEGLTVGDMADMNLVQGVIGSYPGTEFPNFFVNYDGPTESDYTPAESVDDVLQPGRGFWWYMYAEEDFQGDPPPEFTPLAEMTYPLVGTLLTSDTEVAFDAVPVLGAENPIPAYMIGNPFQEPLQLSGVSTDVAGLQTNFFAWNPDVASYVIRGTGDVVSPWQGLFSEVDNPDEPPTYFFSFASTDTTANPPLISLRAGERSFAVDLVLSGTLESGRRVHDLATRLRFESDAMLEWDRHDGSKFMPPLSVASYALLAVEGVRNGQDYLQSVYSLPNGMEEGMNVPLEFISTEPGEFTISATGIGITDGWSFVLRDRETGKETNLLAGTYEFTGVAGENWQDRFEIAIAPAAVVGSEDATHGFRLSTPAPNPVVGTTALVLRVDDAQHVTARVYDALGRLVATAFAGELIGGEEVRLSVDASSLAAGAYVIRVTGESFAESRRITVVR